MTDDAGPQARRSLVLTEFRRYLHVIRFLLLGFAVGEYWHQMNAHHLPGFADVFGSSIPGQRALFAGLAGSVLLALLSPIGVRKMVLINLLPIGVGVAVFTGIVGTYIAPFINMYVEILPWDAKSPLHREVFWLSGLLVGTLIVVLPLPGDPDCDSDFGSGEHESDPQSRFSVRKIALVLFGLWLLLAVNGLRNDEYLANGVRIDAEVIRSRTWEEPEGSDTWLREYTYRYEVDEERHEGKCIFPETHETAYEQEEIPVLYLPDDPSQHLTTRELSVFRE